MSNTPSKLLARPALVGSPLRRPFFAMVTLAVLGIVLLFASLMNLLVFLSQRDGALQVYVTALGISALCSLVPLTILWYLDRRERESPWLFAAAFLWGAVIATGLALPLNNQVFLNVRDFLRANPAVAEYLGPNALTLIAAPIGGPLNEELTKGLGVLVIFLLLRAEFDNMRDGLIYGALVGLGFNWLECALYVAQGYAEYGFAPWGEQFGARYALFGLGGHAMYSGIFGASLGLARQIKPGWPRYAIPALGLLIAILAHAWNNGLGLLVTIILRATGQALPEPGVPEAAPFLAVWVSQTIATLVLFLPFVLLMGAALRRSGHWERDVIREELAEEVGTEVVTPQEYEAIKRDGTFRTRRIAGTNRKRAAALVNAQHELAFRKRRVRADDGDPANDPLAQEWRNEIVRLRAG